MGIIAIIITVIISLLIVRALYKFYKDIKKDDIDLNNSSISQKFNIIVENLNNWCFENKGTYIKVDKRTLKIYDGVSNQIVYLTYSTGILNIVWKYKYYQQEMVYENNVQNARNLTEMEQETISMNLINDFNNKLEEHKRKVNQSGKINQVVDDVLSKQGISKENILKARNFLNKD
ncbi:hypothetical protein EH230_11910 [Flavobacterium columnare]|uniref:Uncharacterized protein n=1 Tax=Flavobacterium columnare TaxID=996 RepID=A0A437UDF2_9FLAO|nr:hypothetical protein [Flavobacterium columnare]RVU91548.1 hypothetical protein EH230_11910 [Flavobacterium columnare]